MFCATFELQIRNENWAKLSYLSRAVGAITSEQSGNLECWPHKCDVLFETWSQRFERFARTSQSNLKNPGDILGDIPDVRKWTSYVKTLESCRTKGGECVYLVMCGHFRSRDKDGGHTVRCAVVVVENPTLYANLMALSFIEPELWAIEAPPIHDSWLQGGPKNGTVFLYVLTSANINRFSKLFHCQKTCNNTITKDPTTPEVCRYTTLWNVSCLKSNNWKQDDFYNNTYVTHVNILTTRNNLFIVSVIIWSNCHILQE